jgi:Trypsin-co-occurring domain 1
MSSAPSVRTVPVDLGDGTIIHIEATVLTSASGSMPEDISFTPGELQFQTMIDLLKKLSALMLDAIKQAQPTKASIEFGIDVGVESGKLTALLVKGEAKGNLKITLEWANSRNDY